MSEIGLDSTVVRSSDVLASSMGEELVMVDLDSGSYFGLDSIGAEIWARLEKPVLVSALCEELEREFEVDPATCTGDVLSLLNRMAEEGLLRTAGATRVDLA